LVSFSNWIWVSCFPHYASFESPSCFGEYVTRKQPASTLIGRTHVGKYPWGRMPVRYFGVPVESKLRFWQ